MTQRERQILAKLELLSEAKVGNLQEGKTSHGKAEGRAPDPGGKTLKDQSLYFYYRQRLQRAETSHKRNLICRAAERDYELRTKGAKRATLLSGATRQHRNEEREAGWVIEFGEGLDPQAIAEELEVPRGWVERVRREARRRVSDGRPVPGFLGWDEDKRREEVQKLSHMSTSKIAEHLGVSRGTIRRYT